MRDQYTPSPDVPLSRYIDAAGYARVNVPGRGYVREHRWVMEQHLGRPLSRSEFVHHRNGNKSDNHLENLEIVTASDHGVMHNLGVRGRRRRQSPTGLAATGRWALNYDCCIECGGTDRPHSGKGLCHRCSVRRWRNRIPSTLCTCPVCGHTHPHVTANE